MPPFDIRSEFSRRNSAAERQSVTSSSALTASLIAAERFSSGLLGVPFSQIASMASCHFLIWLARTRALASPRAAWR